MVLADASWAILREEKVLRFGSLVGNNKVLENECDRVTAVEKL